MVGMDIKASKFDLTKLYYVTFYIVHTQQNYMENIHLIKLVSQEFAVKILEIAFWQ